jgi:hypothetical protein
MSSKIASGLLVVALGMGIVWLGSRSGEVCPACHGSGKCTACQAEKRQGMPCASCNGTKKCPQCGGKRWNWKKKQEAPVPAEEEGDLGPNPLWRFEE